MIAMLRALSLLSYATIVASQFNINHTQYDTSPPVYPSPQISGSGGWEVALNKAQEFLAQLTTEEKAQIVTGKRHSKSATPAELTHPRNFWSVCRQYWPN